MNLIKNLLFIAAALIIFTSCSDEPTAVSHPSYRDGVFETHQLTVLLDGEKINSVKSITVDSEQIPSESGIETTPGTIFLDPVYKSIVSIDGFPTENDKCSFETISNLAEFKGSTTIHGVKYDYHGEFLGDPLGTLHKDQSLKLSFTTK